ncbi:MAG: HNH nuclease family protein [Candidatus Hydrogenedentes bacterium]|nr:HNH nuclease family protein [Candidatus Hydrogenedentota bacterium]
MRLKKTKIDPKAKAQFLDNLRKDRASRESGYREQALALFPHICARCGREFAAKNLAELTVHHKDNNHLNNPPDGSNWELLCVACHDDVHQDGERVNHFGGYALGAAPDQSLGHNPFDALKNLLDDDSNRDT